MYDDENFGSLVMLVDTKEEKSEKKYMTNGFIMPKEMHPTREDFEELGFAFQNIPGDDVLCYASLPEGWSIKPTDQPMWNDIVDENGIARGDMFYRASDYDRDAHMKLFCRYGIRRVVNGKETEIYFGNATEKLFVAGKVTIDFSAENEIVKKQLNIFNDLIMSAQKYAEENYPDWENVHAYWNENKIVRVRK